MWYVICGMWYVLCGMWYVLCGMWYVVCGCDMWGLGLSMVFYVCATGHGHVLNWFLGHPGWTALGRLTYSAYLVHFAFIVFYTAQYGNTFIK